MKFKIIAPKQQSDAEISIASLGKTEFYFGKTGAKVRCYPNKATIVCHDDNTRLETNYRLSSRSLMRTSTGDFSVRWRWSQGISGWNYHNKTIEHCAPGQDNRQRMSAARPLKVDSPLTGNTLKVLKQDGDHVDAGELVMVVEAMKMENQIVAPINGVISNLTATVGQQVGTGEKLFIVKPITE